MAQCEPVKKEAKMYNHSDESLEENQEKPEMSGKGIGHNSQVHPATAAQLRSIIERVERLTEEKANLGADIRDVLAEAKGNGFCIKTIKKIIKLRSMDESDRQKEAYMLETLAAKVDELCEGDYVLSLAVLSEVSRRFEAIHRVGMIDRMNQPKSQVGEHENSDPK